MDKGAGTPFFPSTIPSCLGDRVGSEALLLPLPSDNLTRDSPEDLEYADRRLDTESVGDGCTGGFACFAGATGRLGMDIVGGGPVACGRGLSSFEFEARLPGVAASLGGSGGSEGSGESMTGLLGGVGSLGGQGGSEVSFLVGKWYSCGGGAGSALEKRDRPSSPVSRVAMVSQQQRCDRARPQL